MSAAYPAGHDGGSGRHDARGSRALSPASARMSRRCFRPAMSARKEPLSSSQAAIAYEPLVPAAVAGVRHRACQAAPDLVVPCDDRALALLALTAACAGAGARRRGADRAVARSPSRAILIADRAQRFHRSRCASAAGIAAPETGAARMRTKQDLGARTPRTDRISRRAQGESTAVGAATASPSLRNPGPRRAAGVSQDYRCRAARAACAAWRALSLRRDAHFLRDAIGDAVRAVSSSLQRFVAEHAGNQRLRLLEGARARDHPYGRAGDPAYANRPGQRHAAHRLP